MLCQWQVRGFSSSEQLRAVHTSHNQIVILDCHFANQTLEDGVPTCELEGLIDITDVLLWSIFLKQASLTVGSI